MHAKTLSLSSDFLVFWLSFFRTSVLRPLSFEYLVPMWSRWLDQLYSKSDEPFREKKTIVATAVSVLFWWLSGGLTGRPEIMCPRTHPFWTTRHPTIWVDYWTHHVHVEVPWPCHLTKKSLDITLMSLQTWLPGLFRYTFVRIESNLKVKNWLTCF